jgi:hypothetical protein
MVWPQFWPTGDLSGPPTCTGIRRQGLLIGGHRSWRVEQNDGTPLPAGRRGRRGSLVRSISPTPGNTISLLVLLVGCVSISMVSWSPTIGPPTRLIHNVGERVGFYAPAAKRYSITVEYKNTSGPAKIDLFWSGPGVSGPVPQGNLSPRFDLVTSTSVRESPSSVPTTRIEYGDHPIWGYRHCRGSYGWWVESTHRNQFRPGAGFCVTHHGVYPQGGVTSRLHLLRATEGPVTNTCGVTAGVGQAVC